MKYQNIVILTGAGISAESGIKTFRASDGLWENYRIEDVASLEGFEKDPNLVHHFYNQRRQTLLSPKIKPNPAHLALAEFEKKISKLTDNSSFLIVTQNIDNLHERGGSKQVIHMHGELLKINCQVSQQVFDRTHNTNPQTLCECCQMAGNLRPHIVWFGEIPFYMDKIEAALSRCDLFISIGTSGHVYPAAGFVELARQSGAHTVELNLDPSEKSSAFHESHFNQASKLVPQYFNQLTNSYNFK